MYPLFYRLAKRNKRPLFFCNLEPCKTSLWQLRSFKNVNNFFSIQLITYFIYLEIEVRIINLFKRNWLPRVFTSLEPW